MTDDDKLVIEGFRAAERGDWAGTCPHQDEFERRAWLEGFMAFHHRMQIEPGVEVTLGGWHRKILRALASSSLVLSEMSN